MTLQITLAQLNPVVGDVAGNLALAITAIQKAKQLQSDVIVFPELFLSGYLADDLLYRQHFLKQMDEAMLSLTKASDTIMCLMGHPQAISGRLYNCATLLSDQKILAQYQKQCLPNEGVFDEQRYFEAGCAPCVVEVKGIRIGVVICEDIWHHGPLQQVVQKGAQLILAPNASPFSIDHDEARQTVISKHGIKTPIVYVNMVGGQDDLVFDGGSMVINADNQVCYHAPFFESTLATVTFDKINGFASQASAPPLTVEEKVYRALVLGVRDYVHKNGFQKILLGVSGGIDSALSLAIAVEALGADNVTAVSMPSRYTSELSNDAAKQQAQTLSVTYKNYAIEKVFEAFLESLAPELTGDDAAIAMQNCQSRIRGMMLMTIANAQGALVLTTGNRSELAMGYSTLYGDTAGAFCVLKDVPKTLVYQLSHYVNREKEIIPQSVIDRPPTAELAPNQKDEDSLPPYDVLDPILEAYINQEMDKAEIVAKGYPEATVTRVIKQIHMNEYKRRQSPPGVRINPKAFGRDRRYPITARYKDD